MRFYIDESVSYEVAVRGRERGLDITSSHELGRNGLSDAEQLRLAAAEQRCMVTADKGDFVRLSVQWSQVGDIPHSGVLCLTSTVRRHQIRQLVDLLAQLAADNPEGLPPYLVLYLRLE